MPYSEILEASERVWSAPLEESAVRAVAYALAYSDIFDYPLTVAEVHRYLVGLRASPNLVARTLEEGLGAKRWETRDGYYALPGRLSIVDRRQQRAATASAMWPRALRYARSIAALPFVRMVAVTGALAVCNVDPGSDYDYLVITDPGRVWVTRMAIVQLMVKSAARRGEELCPNYLLSNDALALDEHDLFHAHELAQMVPIYGLEQYLQLRAANSWADVFLPNASGHPPSPYTVQAPARLAWMPLEYLLRTPLGDWLDHRELCRMQAKLLAQGLGPEVKLEASRCKGHSGAHSHSTEAAFGARLQHLR